MFQLPAAAAFAAAQHFVAQEAKALAALVPELFNRLFAVEEKMESLLTGSRFEMEKDWPPKRGHMTMQSFEGFTF